MNETEPGKPQIGVDEWVATADARSERDRGVLGHLRRRFDRVPDLARFGIFIVLVALIPVVTSDQYILRVSVDTLIFALLVLGLNVVVGWAGLLDLGFVAFFGIGAYSYALLSSDHFGIHWEAQFTVPLIVAGTALVGLLLGLTSWRLLGDYLAIVTLFFLQAFVVVTTNRSSISFLGLTPTTDVTGGPNGIPGLDPFTIFGFQIESLEGYFYLGLVTMTLVIAMLYLAVRSRTGRAWHALREDSLAAELMSMPVNRLKLLAFMFGAGIAGLTGTIQAALLGGVFPSSYDVPLLITIYAMLILGGSGSLAGAVVGAIAINVSLEVLRNPDHARWLFYSVILLTLVAKLRPWWKLAAVLGSLVAFGYALSAILGALWPSATGGEAAGGDAIGRGVQSWVVHPAEHATQIGNVGFVLLIALVLLLTVIKDPWRTVLLVPTIYLAAFEWENLLMASFEAQAATRFMLLGALLVVLMAARPNGLIGKPRVEAV
jgi:ABC-type branched-subunit amino acid transport system permease subunit